MIKRAQLNPELAYKEATDAELAIKSKLRRTIKVGLACGAITVGSVFGAVKTSEPKLLIPPVISAAAAVGHRRKTFGDCDNIVNNHFAANSRIRPQIDPETTPLSGYGTIFMQQTGSVTAAATEGVLFGGLNMERDLADEAKLQGHLLAGVVLAASTGVTRVVENSWTNAYREQLGLEYIPGLSRQS